MRHGDSEFLRHIPCPDCGSRDNAALYTDGHEYCFGCGYYKHGDGSEPTNIGGRKRVAGLLRDTEIVPLTKRSISEETARKFGYSVGTYNGEPVQIAPYYDAEGNLVAQKIRTATKDIRWVGDPADALPFGAHAWQRTGRKIVVTEGEIDALSVSQVLGNSWPVVSISCGAGPQIKKYMAQHRDYFNAFDEVVLMFDMDDPGREAVQKAAEVIGPKAKIAVLPMKDANEMLVAGRVKELVDATWRAQKYQPEGIVELADIRERVMQPREWGLTYPWDELTHLTYGIRRGELVGFGGAAGFGKTEFFTEIAAHLITEHGEKVGLFFLEQAVAETGKHLCGKVGNKRFHLPSGIAGWTQEELEAAWDGLLAKKGKVYLYDSFGVNEWEAVEARIRHLHHAEDVNYFFLDHLTALATHKDDERKELDRIMSSLGSLVKELNITVFFISHLATPEGTPHEEGGHVALKHLRGSRSIAYWSTFVLGGERNQQAEDPVARATATIRVVKDREGGNTGETFFLRYEKDTGRLVPSGPPPSSTNAHGLANDGF
jgi:twinkle protein